MKALLHIVLTVLGRVTDFTDELMDESLKAEGIIAANMTILAEGDAANRDDIIYLERLPLFDKEGNVL